MNELKELIQVTVADILSEHNDLVEVGFGVVFDTDRPCLASIELAYQNEIVSSNNHVAPFCAALCNYNAAIFVDAVRETISKALMKGEK